MTNATKIVPSSSEAREIWKGARRIHKRLGEGRYAEFEREHSAECAPVVCRIVGSRPGAKRISIVDLATLAAIHHSGGDLDGTCRHAIMIELQRAPAA